MHSVDENNSNVRSSLAILVHKLMMTASKIGKSMTTAAYYKSKINARIATRVVSW